MATYSLYHLDGTDYSNAYAAASEMLTACGYGSDTNLDDLIDRHFTFDEDGEIVSFSGFGPELPTPDGLPF